MIVCGIDPGTEKSSVVHYNGASVLLHAEFTNDELLAHLGDLSADVVVLERVASYGMAVGEEIFATVFWSGRFAQAWAPKRWERLFRKDIKQHLCHTNRATDANIRQALIDRFGPGVDKAVGKKKSPGPLFGIKSHCWAALAVAITWYDQFGHLPQDVRPGIRPEF